MKSANKVRKLSVLLRTASGGTRKAVIWIMIVAVVQTLLLPMASHAEMTGPQISDSIGVGLLAGLVVFIIAVALLSKKNDVAAAAQAQNPDRIITVPTDIAPSPCPPGTVAIASW